MNYNKKSILEIREKVISAISFVSFSWMFKGKVGKY